LPGRVGGGGFGLTNGSDGGGAFLTTAGGHCTRLHRWHLHTTTIIFGGGDLTKDDSNGGGAFLGRALGLNGSADDCESPLIANK
jgi:hypothetical protein